MAAEPIHVKPTAALAPRALLPGDPGRALALAQTLLDEPRMFNHNRGLWGYTGIAADGHALTIQSTGMGGPSAAIVVTELIELGLRRAIRVGSAGALDGALSIGDVVIASEAISADGTSSALAAAAAGKNPEAAISRRARDAADEPPRMSADERLTAALVRAGPAAATGAVVSTDLFYDGDPQATADWIRAGAIAVEMETATLFALASRRGIEAASVLLISDLLEPDRRTRIGERDLHDAGERIGRIAADALAATEPGQPTEPG